MVTDESAWSLKLEAWVPELVDAGIPLLGICYGHQVMARALGGRVDYQPMGLEIGTKKISCSSDYVSDPLFSGLPGEFKAHVTHSQTVVQPPPSAVVLAKNSFEAPHALRMGKAAWGVQFHPEYTPSIMKAYLEQLSGAVKESGQNPYGLMDRVEKTPESALVLARFAALARQ